jgi:hypothetical protein
MVLFLLVQRNLIVVLMDMILLSLISLSALGRFALLALKAKWAYRTFCVIGRVVACMAIVGQAAGKSEVVLRLG